ncbi:MAG TPA: HTTM domain-containing protein [Pirellulales bacterium]
MQNANAKGETQNAKPADRPVERWRARCGAVLAWLAGGFGIDVRSLAAFRMAIASMVLVDLAERLPDLTAHYSDLGVLPRAARVVMETNGSTTSGSWAWSLHQASGSPAGQALLFLLAAGCALSMLAGFRTRWATFACWLFTVSIYYRNPMLEDAGDTILHTVLFWSMFLPLGAAASLDRCLEQPVPPVPRRIVSVPGAALLLQICQVYWATAAEKHSPAWLSEHTALYYTLSLDAFVTPLGHRLLAYPQLLKGLTAFVYWFEWLGPILALLPVRRGLPRLLAVFGFWSLHLGIALTLELGAMPWISLGVWTIALPGAFWDRLQAIANHALAWRRPWAWPSGASAIFRRLPPGRPSYRPPGRITNVLVAALALYTIVWNVNQVTGLLEGRLSPSWKAPAYVLGLEQTWRMFAPYPITEDGWYEMRGVLADGSEVNLWEHDQPPPRRKPPNVAQTYRNRRWRKYLLGLRVYWTPFVPEFVAWLTRQWNDEYAGEAPQRRVRHVDIIYHIEETLSPDRRSTLIVPEIVFEGDVADSSPQR